LLAIPHFLVLIFLWIAVLVVTFIAWLAILFSGRYPRGMFGFVEGVVRWDSGWSPTPCCWSPTGTHRSPLLRETAGRPDGTAVQP
jgi:hypothetical protein